MCTEGAKGGKDKHGDYEYPNMFHTSYHIYELGTWILFGRGEGCTEGAKGGKDGH